MANSGFSAAESYFGTITGLTPKESSDGKTGSVAEAQSALGDTIAHDEYAQLMAPSTTYAVTADVTLSNLPALGSIVGTTNKIMVTQVAINTSAGQPPTVTISGQEVHADATAKRTYAISGSLLARCKAQDVCTAFTQPASTDAWDWNSVTTTFSVDFVKQSVAGVIVAACATHGRVEVSATATAPSGSVSLTAQSNDWAITAPASKSAPDEGYVSITATATKWIPGVEANAGGGGSV